MPNFTYRALTVSGERVAGELEAADMQTAIARLQDSGLIPIDAAQAGRTDRRGAVPVAANRALRHVTQLTRELATLLNAGQTVERALVLASDEVSNRRLAAALSRILVQIRSGASLSEALAEEPSFFSTLYVGMVHAGEQSGKLTQTLKEIALMRTKYQRLRSELITTLIKPALLLVTAIIVIIIILTKVVPELKPMFESSGAELPYNMQIIINISTIIQEDGYIILMLFAFTLLLFERMLMRQDFHQAVDQLLLRLPFIGALLRDRIAAHFSRGLATCLGGGLDLPTALAICRDVLRNLHARAAIEDVIVRVRTGRTFADSLAVAKILPPIAVKILRIGEESGCLQPMALNIAEMFEDRISENLKRLTALAEPVLTVAVGGIAGFILLTIADAILNTNQLAMYSGRDCIALGGSNCN